MSKTNGPETPQERYLRCLHAAEECMAASEECPGWDRPDTAYFNDHARTWAILAQSAATMCLAEADSLTADIERMRPVFAAIIEDPSE